MIKVNELRIGNYVEFPMYGIGIVSDIDSIFNQASKKGDCLEHDAEDIMPITLTEGWLLKFGFNKFLGKMFSEHMILLYCNDYYIALIGDKMLKILSVHQLQNLYFALTGNELEVVNG